MAPHQCIHCAETYPDGAKEVLEGCSKCNSRFFFFLNMDKYNKILAANSAKEANANLPQNNMEDERLQSILTDLSSEDKHNMEQDVREIMGIEDIEAPVILDLETVKVTSPGKYILDIPNLFRKDRPLVYKLEDGKYVIDLSSTIKKK